MKILVSGGAGFIGSHVVEKLLQEHQVIVMDDMSCGKKVNIPADVQLFEGKIQDADFVDRVLSQEKPDVIIHLAAQVSVVVSTKQPLDDASSNILGTITLLDAAAKHKIGRFIYTSSGGAMYGNPASVPCTEDTIAEPVSPYGLSKYTAERYVKMFEKLYNLPTVVLRFANVFGPRQDPYGEAGVCSIFTEKLMHGGDATIFGDGSQVRDYVYVGDVARAVLAAVTRGTSESFNIGTGVGTSTMQVFETIKEATGYQKSPVMGPKRPGEVQAVILDVSKAKLGLDWQPEVDFKLGIQKTVDWFKSN